MSRTTDRASRGESQPEPTWEVAHLFPALGAWSEEVYLALDGNRLVEFSHDCLDVLPLPTTSHQLLVAYLDGLLLEHVTRNDLGTVVSRLRLSADGEYAKPQADFGTDPTSRTRGRCRRRA